MAFVFVVWLMSWLEGSGDDTEGTLVLLAMNYLDCVYSPKGNSETYDKRESLLVITHFCEMNSQERKKMRTRRPRPPQDDPRRVTLAWDGTVALHRDLNR